MESKEADVDADGGMKADHTRSLLQHSHSTNRARAPASNAALPKVKVGSNVVSTISDKANFLQCTC